MPGRRFSRYGSTYGQFASPVGTPIPMRALPPNTDLSNYNEYMVIKPFEVEKSIIAPAFDKIGLGVQYFTLRPIQTLLNKGIITPVKPVTPKPVSTQ